ncbi:MAG: hypothetical protein MZU97_07830 [Bacillus subtilis]|nr:hypothetical protein [Bacillus subtilis]
MTATLPKKSGPVHRRIAQYAEKEREGSDRQAAETWPDCRRRQAGYGEDRKGGRDMKEKGP